MDGVFVHMHARKEFAHLGKNVCAEFEEGQAELEKRTPSFLTILPEMIQSNSPAVQCSTGKWYWQWHITSKETAGVV